MLTPTHSLAEYLTGSVQGALRDDHDALEIKVSDDASSETTGAITGDQKQAPLVLRGTSLT
jgi:hypothetical protein